MDDHSNFVDLLQRVGHGDPVAATEIVRKYESAIRVGVRTRLSDPKLRRQFDSMDVCQSVLASFFLRVSSGQYDLRDPAQLVALLTKMAHNKLAMRVRREFRRRRDLRRTVPLDNLQSEPEGNASDPSQLVVGKELVDRAFGLMNSEVREMAECRTKGMEWPEIAVKIGGTPEARRKQFKRAVDRIARTLGIE